MQDKAPKQADVKDMMAAREARAMRQQTMLMARPLPLVSFTLNIPGPVKNSPLIADAFDFGITLIENRLRQNRIQVVETQLIRAFTGDHLLMSCQADPLALKCLMCQLDEENAFGRLMDIDVLDTQGFKIPREAVGFPPRPCLMCGEPVSVCAPSRIHRAEDLFFRAMEIITLTLRTASARLIAGLAQQSLLTEALVTPKPGLVDQANTGAHQDMDLSTFISSACALRAYFEDAALLGMRQAGADPASIMPALRALGLCAEARMYEATGGVNTHKGAIYALGILSAAAGRILAQRSVLSADTLFDTAALIARDEVKHLPALAAKDASTTGLRLYASQGITGARGEAMAGFPAVRHTALPQLRRYLAAGHSMNDALAFTLIHLIPIAQDTNLMKRAGSARFMRLQQEIRALISQGPLSISTIQALDQQFIAENLSPGGSADLLAAAYFGHGLEHVNPRGISISPVPPPFCTSLD